MYVQACMAAGSLCGVVITPLLIGLTPDDQATPATLPTAPTVAAAGMNCSLKASDVDCFRGSTPYTSTLTTERIRRNATIVDEQLLNQV